MNIGVVPPRLRACEGRMSIRHEGHAEFDVACGKCEPCRARKVHNFAGRVAAEALGADAVYFVTLSIGGDRRYLSHMDNVKANAFFKEDVQRFIKRERRFMTFDFEEQLKAKGQRPEAFVAPKLRYVCVGETGSSENTERTHYHLVLFCYGWSGPGDWIMSDIVANRYFFHGKMGEDCSVELYPEVLRVKSERTHWPWGTTHVRAFVASDGFYVGKYMWKAWSRIDGEKPFMRPLVSTVPLMGAGLFDDIACNYVENGLGLRLDARWFRLPQAWGDAPREFFMSRTAALYTAKRYLHHLSLGTDGAEPYSPFMDGGTDPKTGQWMDGWRDRLKVDLGGKTSDRLLDEHTEAIFRDRSKGRHQAGLFMTWLDDEPRKPKVNQINRYRLLSRGE